MKKILSVLTCVLLVVLSGCKAQGDLNRPNSESALPKTKAGADPKNNPASDAKAQLPESEDAGKQAGAEDQYQRGVSYVKGDDVQQDYAEACKWFRLAAERGHAAAQYSLGIRYTKGEGVAQDFGEASKWYRRAAHQGLAAAQFSLGIRYVQGKGVPRDYVEAYKWFTIAEMGGVERAAKSLENIEKNRNLLSAEEIEEAKTRAAEFVAHPSSH